MLNPITRGPMALFRSATCCLAPAPATLNSQTPAIREPDKADPRPDTNQVHSRSGPAVLTGIEGRIVRIFGMTNTDRIVGPTLLRFVLSRNFSSAAMSSSTALFLPLQEPYGSVIQSLQSRFLNAGLFKIHEDATSVTFSDGTHKLQIVTDRPTMPSEAGYFIDSNGKSHRLRGLQKQFHPEAYFKEVGDLKNILDKYGVEDIGTSHAVKEEAIRDYLSLSFRQMINFMGSNKKLLSKL